MKVWIQRFGLRLVGVGLLTYVLLTSDWKMVGRAFSQISVPAVIAIELLSVAILLAKAWRWHCLLRLQAIRYPFGRAFLVYVYSLSMGALSLSYVGELLKVGFLNREAKAPVVQSLATVITDRMLDVTGLCLMLLFGVGVYVWKLTESGAALLVLAVLGLGIVTVSLLACFRSQKLLAWVVYNLARYGRLGSVLSGSLDNLAANLVKILRPTLIGLLMITAIAMAIGFFQNMLYAHQIGVDLNMLQVGFALSLVSLVSLLPISVMGLGTREATLIYVFHLYGLPQAAAVSYSLLIFAIQLVTSFLLVGITSSLMRLDAGRSGVSSPRVNPWPG